MSRLWPVTEVILVQWSGALDANVRMRASVISIVWNGLYQSAGFIIQSSLCGFGLDLIRNSPTQRILDWTGSRNVQCVSHI